MCVQRNCGRLVGADDGVRTPHPLQIPCLRRLLRCSLVALILPLSFIACPPHAHAAGRQTTTGLPTLTTAAAVHNLTLSEATQHYPVHMRAVCIVCFTGWHGLFVNDGKSDVFVETKNQKLLTAAIHPGTLLDIQGISGPAEYAPVVDQADLKILGTAPIPPARPVSLDRLSTGVEDGQWISFEGTVRTAALRDSMLELIVASGPLQIGVMTLPAGPAQFNPLIHARIRVSGTAGPIFNPRRQLIGVNVYSPTLASIQVLESAPADPFSLPIRAVDRVFEYAPEAAPVHLVRIRGVVSARWGQTVFMSDGMQGASVRGSEPTSLKPGDFVDAVGYPSLGDTSHTIDDAIFRRLGASALPQPQAIDVKEALSGDFQWSLVRLSGQLIQKQETADQYTLLLKSGGAVFSAVFPAELKEQSIDNLQEGSQLELTGICVITETQAQRHFRLPRAFQVLLRSPSDVRVLERPSWLTPAHALVVLALALAGTMLVLAWVIALRRRVAQQTTLLRQQANLLRASEQKFRHMAQHDSLTGLATRIVLKERLNAALESCRKFQTSVGVLILDVDKFKDINDSVGHQAGDEVLRVTAKRLLETVRSYDTVVRLGGDEFLVLLPSLPDPEIAASVAAAALAALSRPVDFEGNRIPITVSIGLSTGFAGESDSHTLLKHADLALYSAKAHGRHCFRVFTPNLEQPGAESNSPVQEPEANSVNAA